VQTDNEAVSYLLGGSFDPDREVLLHDAPDALARAAPNERGTAAPAVPASRVEISHEDPRELLVRASAPQDGFLLVADTFYPGWTAEVDGTPTPLYRANLSVRAIQLPQGTHDVRFSYDPPGFFRGAWITALAASALLIWTAVAAYMDRRARR
jgi:hypothetical protein